MRVGSALLGSYQWLQPWIPRGGVGQPTESWMNMKGKAPLGAPDLVLTALLLGRCTAIFWRKNIAVFSLKKKSSDFQHRSSQKRFKESKRTKTWTLRLSNEQILNSSGTWISASRAVGGPCTPKLRSCWDPRALAHALSRCPSALGHENRSVERSNHRSTNQRTKQPIMAV